MAMAMAMGVPGCGAGHDPRLPALAATLTRLFLLCDVPRNGQVSSVRELEALLIKLGYQSSAAALMDAMQD